MISLAVFAVISFSYVSAETLYQKNDCRTKIEEIDREIQYLEDLKRGLDGRAIRYENQAQRLQFDQEQLIEAKRFWNMAEQNKKASAELEQKIKEKRIERQHILETECKDYNPATCSQPSKEAALGENEPSPKPLVENSGVTPSSSENKEISSAIVEDPIKNLPVENKEIKEISSSEDSKDSSIKDNSKLESKEISDIVKELLKKEKSTASNNIN